MARTFGAGPEALQSTVLSCSCFWTGLFLSIDCQRQRFFCLFCFLRNPFGRQLPSCSVGLHTEKFVYFILNHVIQIFAVIFRDEFHRLKSLPKATQSVTW